MIRYALVCEGAHEWEGWFGSIADYDAQSARGLVTCPICGTKKVRKQIMAPAVVTSKSDRPKAPVAAPPAETLDAPPEVKAFFDKWRSHIEQNYDYVGDAFAEEARKIHEGESDERLIYGEASSQEARALIEDGVPVAPLPPAASPKARKRSN